MLGRYRVRVTAQARRVTAQARRPRTRVTRSVVSMFFEDSLGGVATNVENIRSSFRLLSSVCSIAVPPK